MFVSLHLDTDRATNMFITHIYTFDYSRLYVCMFHSIHTGVYSQKVTHTHTPLLCLACLHKYQYMYLENVHKYKKYQ